MHDQFVNKSKVEEILPDSLDPQDPIKSNCGCYQKLVPNRNSSFLNAEQELRNAQLTKKKLTKKVSYSFEDSPNPPKISVLTSWSILPIILILTTTIGLVVTYVLAKNNCHVQRFIWPYVSYTGTEYPERMIFGLIMNLEGFLGSIVVFLAWRYYRHMGQRGWLNRLALISGALSCFGVILVGNFQVTKAKVPHYIGAGFAFIIGTGYGVLTAILSKKAFRYAVPKLKYGNCIAALRITLACLMVIALACLIAAGIIKTLTFQNVSKDQSNFTFVKDENGSCEDVLGKIPPNHRFSNLIAAIIEWFLTYFLLLCLFLFFYEFQTFQNVKVVLLKHDRPLQCRKSNPNNRADENQMKRHEAAGVNGGSENYDDGSEKLIGHRTYPGKIRHHCFYDDLKFHAEHPKNTQLSGSITYPLTPEHARTATVDSGIEDDVTHRHDVDENTENDNIKIL